MPRGKRKNVDQAENVGPDGTCTTAEVPTAAVLSAAAEQQQTFDASYVEELLEGISEEGEFSRLLTTNSTPRLLYDVSRGNTSPHAHFVLSSRCECPPFTAVSPNPGAAFKTTVEKRCNGIQQLADHKKKQLNLIFREAMMRVKKGVKRMKVQDFVAEHGPLPFVESSASSGGAGGDEDEEQDVLQTAVKGGRNKGKGKAPASSKKAKNAMAPPAPSAATSSTSSSSSSSSSAHVVAATPRASRSQLPMATPKFDPANMTAETPGLRSMKDGEVMMSVNGSPIAFDRKVVLTAVKDGTKAANGGKGFEVNVLGDTMRLGSPSAANKVQNDPAMQETLLEMKRQMDALLGTVGVSTADC
jgi:hypothetical protein